jgi:fibronectin-binding autotransporter adhesin
MKCFYALSFCLMFGIGWTRAQQTITYTNGEVGNAGIVVTPSTNPTSLAISSGSATQSGVISESGGSFAVTKDGAGLLTLTGANTYTGVTTIDSGTLAIGAGGSIATSSELNLASSGTTFNISSGGSQMIQTLIGVSPA